MDIESVAMEELSVEDLGLQEGRYDVRTRASGTIKNFFMKNDVGFFGAESC